VYTPAARNVFFLTGGKQNIKYQFRFDLKLPASVSTRNVQ